MRRDFYTRIVEYAWPFQPFNFEHVSLTDLVRRRLLTFLRPPKHPHSCELLWTVNESAEKLRI